MLKIFKKNDIGKDFVVGDLHGEYTKLMNHLNMIGFNKKKDRLFCCGDLIDRGLESIECLNLIYEPWFFSVRGNHEQMLIDSIGDERATVHWYMNGGIWASELDENEIKMYAGEIDRFMPHQIQIEKIGIVHADVGGKWYELTDDRLDACLWDRTRIKRPNSYGGEVAGIDTMYVGHTPTKEKVVIGNVHYMDSGAVFGNDLRIEEIIY